MKLPECTGWTSWTDWGYEFDCDAIHGQSCEDCLCTYKSFGGLWHPETGKKIHPVIALLRYGAKNTEQLLQPKTPNNSFNLIYKQKRTR